MRFSRGIWVGATLLLALAGCSDDSPDVKGGGSYSPIITGISSSTEPAARGIPNQLTAQITNVNNLPLTYRWRVAAGTLADSTAAVATWTPPDSIGTWDVTLTVEATDPSGAHFSKTTVVHMAVDNQFTRWTRSDALQFDPAPIPGGGGILYSQIQSTSTGASDIYRVDTPLGGSLKLTEGFHSATSPSARGDLLQFVFAGKEDPEDVGNTIWLLPWAGGTPSSATPLDTARATQPTLESPRFAPQGTRVLFTSDSVAANFPKLRYRDAAAPGIPAVDIIEPSTFFLELYRNGNWGPDVNSDGFPDSVVAMWFNEFNFPPERGLVRLGTQGNATDEHVWLVGSGAEEPDWSPDGNHIVFARKNTGTNERDIWIINRAASDFSAAVRVTSGPADESHPRFAQDGSSIFFVSNRVDRYGLNGVYGTERRGTNIWSVARFDRP
jgi:Tol biopolymer transport system component